MKKKKVAIVILILSIMLLLGLVTAFFSDTFFFTSNIKTGIIDLDSIILLTEKDSYGDDTDYINNMLPGSITNWLPGDVTTIEWTVANTGNKSAWTRNILSIAWNATDDLAEKGLVYIYPVTMSDDAIREDIANNSGNLSLSNAIDDTYKIETGNKVIYGIVYMFLGNVLDGIGTGAETGDASVTGNHSQTIRLKVALSPNTLKSYENKPIYIGVKAEALQYRNNPSVILTDKKWPSTIEKFVYLADVVHPGDYVNYDAGNWTVNKTVASMTYFEFGGHVAGKSRNKSSTCIGAGTQEGWRVLEVEEKTIKLIHAGVPECYYHAPNSYGANIIYNSIKILTGETKGPLITTYPSALHSYSHYVDTNYAISATVFTKEMLEKYVGRTVEYGDTLTDSLLYLVNNSYWLADRYSANNNMYSMRNTGAIGASNNAINGIRPVVTLKNQILTKGQDSNNVWQLIR